MAGLLAMLGVGAKTVAVLGTAADVLVNVGNALMSVDAIERILSGD